VTEPPFAEFLKRLEASGDGLAPHSEPYIASAAGSPIVPDTGVMMADALTTLGKMLASLRPNQRPKRTLRVESPPAVAWPQSECLGLEYPRIEPVWVRSLGVSFGVVGLDGGGTLRPVLESEEPAFESGGVIPVGGNALTVFESVQHGPIPSRRGRRPVQWEQPLEFGLEWKVSAPVVAPPRLRIHLPKPIMAPFRPRYAFAPKPPEASQSPEALESVLPAGGTPDGAGDAVPAAGTNAAAGTASAVPTPEPTIYQAPTFGGMAEQPADGWLRRLVGWRKAGAGGLVVASLAGVAWTAQPAHAMLPSGPAVCHREAAVALDPGKWELEAGKGRAGSTRRIRYFGAGAERSDYVLEFSAEIEREAITWLYRRQDAGNYYAMRLEQRGEGRGQLFAFAVAGGVESKWRRIPAEVTLRKGTGVRVRVDVRGGRFATAIDGRLVDMWTDTRLQVGTVGFASEGEERAEVRTVTISD
jgi:hypothetical protein